MAKGKDEKPEDFIYRAALENALKFRGKANPKALLGRVLGRFPEYRKDTKKAMQLIEKVVKRVNALSKDKQTAEMKRLVPDFFEKEMEKRKIRKEERLELPELPNAKKGRVVTRMPPEPSKYNHIGHALTFLINYMYAQKYSGRCVLRFEDVNPEKVKQEYVDAMKKDVLDYLEIKPDKTVYVSDDMDKLYMCAEKIITQGDAFVCSCSRDQMSRNRRQGKGCRCRRNSAEKNMQEWKKMLDGTHKPGECVLRLKIDMKHRNTTMRDPVIFRIDQQPHYKYKNRFRVWPIYDYYTAIEDNWCGVTHVLRSSEFEMRGELQNHIRSLLNMPNPEIAVYGRFNIKGAVTQGREIREMIEQGKVTGWDDPSLVTLRALKRRGIVRDTYYELAVRAGMSKQHTNIDWTVISTINRKFLDERANRFYFLENPAEITVEGAPQITSILDLHPAHRKGGRTLKSKGKFLVEKDDLKKLKVGEMMRLMNCLNFVKEGKEKYVFDSESHKEFKEKNGRAIVHWLPADDRNIRVSIRMPDSSFVEGPAEPNITKIKQGEVIQFERYAFARLDNKKQWRFWFTHK